MSTIPVTTARSQLYRLIDQVNEDSEPLVITGQRGNAVLVGEEDWRAIQETLYLESVPGMMDSIRNADVKASRRARKNSTGELVANRVLTSGTEGREETERGGTQA